MVMNEAVFAVSSVAVRMFGVPAPSVGHDSLGIRTLWYPPQVATNPLSGGVEHRGVTGSSRRRTPGNRQTRHLFNCGDHVLD